MIAQKRGEPSAFGREIGERFEHLPAGVHALERRRAVRRRAVGDKLGRSVRDALCKVAPYLSSHLCAAFGHHDIDPLAALQRDDLFWLCERQADVSDPLFAVDDGKVCVGRNALFGHFLSLEIALYALPTRLLVAAPDEADAAFGLFALFEQGQRRIERERHRPLVVEHASAVKDAVLDLAQRVGVPAAAERNGVEVTEDAEQVALACLRPDIVAVAQTDFEPAALCVVGDELQALRDALAERACVARRRLNTVDRDQLFQSAERLIKHIGHIASRNSSYIIYTVLRKKATQTARRASLDGARSKTLPKILAARAQPRKITLQPRRDNI